MPRFRSNHPKVFLWKGVLEICSKFTGEHPRRTVILIKLQSNFTETHFNMDVLLWNCCIFLEHLFLEVPLGGCVCRFVPHGRCNDALFQLITTGLRSCCVRNAVVIWVTGGYLWLSEGTKLFYFAFGISPFKLLFFGSWAGNRVSDYAHCAALFAAIIAALFCLGGAIGWLIVVGRVGRVLRGWGGVGFCRVDRGGVRGFVGCGAMWLGAALSFYGNFPDIS